MTLSCSNLDGFMHGPLASPSITAPTLLTPGVGQVLNAKVNREEMLGRRWGEEEEPNFLRCTQ